METFLSKLGINVIVSSNLPKGTTIVFNNDKQSMELLSKGIVKKDSAVSIHNLSNKRSSKKRVDEKDKED